MYKHSYWLDTRVVRIFLRNQTVLVLSVVLVLIFYLFLKIKSSYNDIGYTSKDSSILLYVYKHKTQ